MSTISLSYAAFSTIRSQKSTPKEVLGKQIEKVASKSNDIITVTIKIPSIYPSATPTKTPVPTKKPFIQSSTKPINSPTPTKFATNKNYTAEKIGESTYRIDNVSNDDHMASVGDILNALNSYRGSNGAANLSWDDNLANLSRDRTNTFASKGGLDAHAGFRDFMNNDGFSKVGFNSLGENSAQLAGNMNGERIIKEIFGADAEHDGNQLDPSWTHVGISINGNFVNINFGKGKR